MVLLSFRTLWDPEMLSKNVDRKKYQESKYEVHTRDSVEDKLKYMKIEAGLKMSFLGGLISVEGSASYLNDHKWSKRASRVTVQFHAETHFEQLTMAHLALDKIQYPAVLDDKEATHVVVGMNIYSSRTRGWETGRRQF